MHLSYEHKSKSLPNKIQIYDNLSFSFTLITMPCHMHMEVTFDLMSLKLSSVTNKLFYNNEFGFSP